ncbi:MAG: MerR family transcriptional regulator [Coriobacteriales bacterium]|jgi:DNA-binding transcriptional MerR regulator|nr:MerR family transcriptional regulator [Coriobacteriales bacterium]
MQQTIVGSPLQRAPETPAGHFSNATKITNPQVPDAEVMSVGELARKVGVTIRTIQYYDQQGLLPPSTKGAQNRRLYTREDQETLNRILTLKHLGFPLAQIKQEIGLYRDAASLRALVNRKIDGLEKDFQELFRRMSILHDISEVTGGDAALDWEAIAGIISRYQNSGHYSWHLTCVNEDDSLEDDDEEGPVRRNEWVLKLHELIADTISLMYGDKNLSSPENRSLARRYLELDGEDHLLSANQVFILMRNLSPHHEGDNSFDNLRQTVFDYLERVVAAYQDTPDMQEV